MEIVLFILVVVLFLILSWFIHKVIYKYTRRNFRKVLKIIYSVYIPIGIIMWIIEFYVYGEYFAQVGFFYIALCILVIPLSIVSKLIEDKFKVYSHHGDVTFYLYRIIYIMNMMLFIYISIYVIEIIERI